MQMTKPMFQPAPRPRPLTSSEDAQQLAAATGDLGFTRPSTAPTPSPEVKRDIPAAEPVSPVAQVPKSPIVSAKGAALKFEVPDTDGGKPIEPRGARPEPKKKGRAKHPQGQRGRPANIRHQGRGRKR